MKHTVIGEAGTLDEDAAAVLALISESGRPPLHLLGVAAAREAIAASRGVMGLPPPSVQTRDFDAPLRGGMRPMRLYRPRDAKDDERLPLAIYFHGGGWIAGDLAYGDWFCASLVDRLRIAVLAVDYRLAPEHRFPAAADDAIDALDWAQASAQILGVRADAFAVMGDSAGGNLAAICAIHARDKAIALKSQVLIYPVIDLGMGSDSYRRNGEGYVLTATAMAWFKTEYLNGGDDKDWRVSLHRAHLRGMAPALVISGGFDVLADEGRDYAAGLDAAGVPVQHLHFAGQLHGFLMWAAKVRQSNVALAAIADYLRETLGP